MRSREVIYLVSKSIQPDSLGNQREVEVKRKVYANQKSVGINEFYSAGTNGFKPERTFSIYTFEYQGENELTHNDISYKIVRAPSRGDKTDLICERIVADGY